MTTYYADFGNPLLGRAASSSPDGSYANPYNTVAPIAAALAAGNDVLVRRSSVLRFGSGAANSGTVALSAGLWQYQNVRPSGIVTLGYYGNEDQPPQFDSLIYDAPGSGGWASAGGNLWSKTITGLNGTTNYPFTFADCQCGDDKSAAYQLRMRSTTALCTNADDVNISAANPAVVTINTGSAVTPPDQMYNGLAWSASTGNGVGAIYMYGGSNQLFDGIEVVGGAFQVAGSSDLLNDHDLILNRCSSKLGRTLGMQLASYRKNLTFASAPGIGATSGTLSGNFSGTTGSYRLYFASVQPRDGTLTNGSTSVTWSVALTASGGTSVGYDNLANTITGAKMLDCLWDTRQRSGAAPDDETSAAFGVHNGIDLRGNLVGVEIRNPRVLGGYRHTAISVSALRAASLDSTFPSGTRIYGTSRTGRSLIECVPYEYSRAFGASSEGSTVIENIDVTGQSVNSQVSGVTTVNNVYFHAFTREPNPSKTNNNGGGDNGISIDPFESTSDADLYQYLIKDVTVKNSIFDGPTNYAVVSANSSVASLSPLGGAKVYNNLIIENGLLPKLLQNQGNTTIGLGIPWLSEGPQASIMAFEGGNGITSTARFEDYRNNVVIRGDGNVYAIKNGSGRTSYTLYDSNDTVSGAYVQPVGNTRGASLQSMRLSPGGRPLPGSTVIGTGSPIARDRDALGNQRPKIPSAGPFDMPTHRRRFDSDPAGW